MPVEDSICVDTRRLSFSRAFQMLPYFSRCPDQITLAYCVCYALATLLRMQRTIHFTRCVHAELMNIHHYSLHNCCASKLCSHSVMSFLLFN